MEELKTKYGIIKGISNIGRYNTGEINDLKLEKENIINLNNMKLIPLYSYDDPRRKELPSIKFYKTGELKSITLQNSIIIHTSIGKISVEKLVFYEDGSIKRIFPLYGKISGYWSEEDEYDFGKYYYIELGFVEFKSKIMSATFYNEGQIKSITLWPKERVLLNNISGMVNARIGISLYKNGKLESCEPSKESAINTPIGVVEAYDKNAIGIHGENNSLKFNEDGTVKSLITSSNVIEVIEKESVIAVHSPKEISLFSNSEEKDLITVHIEFKDRKVIIDKEFIYDMDEFKFKITYFGEKKFYLGGTDISRIRF